MNFQGESLFLRAFIHFDLLRLFGEQGPSFGGTYPNNKDAKGIILREGVADASNAITARSTIEECYQLIIKDLKKAERPGMGSKTGCACITWKSISVHERLYQCQNRI